MKKILVLVENYPDNNGGVSLMYVHTRNKAYSISGIDVTVLSFQAKENYIYDGIRVITTATYQTEKQDYDILVCHAANIRNHYRFLKKNSTNFPKYVFFFHGHEVLKIHSTYAKPYSYVCPSKYKVILQNLYDDFKLMLWRHYYSNISKKAHFVFVSGWMLNEFLKWTKIPFSVIENNHMITYNCIGKVFEETKYDHTTEKEYDFITIRSYMDGSKYCIDIVNDLAHRNPELKFLVVGTGEFFDHFEKAPNLTWHNGTMNHTQIINALQRSRCALMPTRTDAQGLMMCELASTGMPLITSNIAVCQEVFDDFDNVALIDNANPDVDLKAILVKLESGMPFVINRKYYNSNTSQKEIDLLKNI